MKKLLNVVTWYFYFQKMIENDRLKYFIQESIFYRSQNLHYYIAIIMRSRTSGGPE